MAKLFTTRTTLLPSLKFTVLPPLFPPLLFTVPPTPRFSPVNYSPLWKEVRTLETPLPREKQFLPLIILN